MKKKKLMITFSLILLIGLGFFIYNKVNSPKNVCIHNNCFEVEVAKSPEQRQVGLSGRERLGENKGMFFEFETLGNHSFWMKDTYIPLDIIWIDEINKVVYIKEKAEPCKSEPCEKFTPDKDAKYVLEIKGGKVNEIGLKVGETLER